MVVIECREGNNGSNRGHPECRCKYLSVVHSRRCEKPLPLSCLYLSTEPSDVLFDFKQPITCQLPVCSRKGETIPKCHWHGESWCLLTGCVQNLHWYFMAACSVRTPMTVNQQSRELWSGSSESEWFWIRIRVRNDDGDCLTLHHSPGVWSSPRAFFKARGGVKGWLWSGCGVVSWNSWSMRLVEMEVVGEGEWRDGNLEWYRWWRSRCAMEGVSTSSVSDVGGGSLVTEGGGVWELCRYWHSYSGWSDERSCVDF